MVAASLLMVVSVSLLRFLEQTTSITSRTTSDVRAEEALEVGLRTITEDLRSASAISACQSTGYASCVVVDIPRSAVPAVACPQSRITYTLSGTNVTETRLNYPSNCGTPTTAINGRAIITRVVSTGASLFTYYDKNGNTIDPVAAASSIPGAASILTTVSVAYGGSTTPTLTLTSIAAVRNNR